MSQASPASSSQPQADAPTTSLSRTRTDIETRFIRKATLDETFRQRLEQTPQTVWNEEFADTEFEHLTLRVFEDTDDTVYLVIPWHAEDFRHQLNDRPRDTWKREFGTAKLKGFVIRVLEEPTDEFYLVLPRSDTLKDEELEAFSQEEKLDFEAEDSVSSPALRFLRINRFTRWRPRNKIERILYLFQAKGLNYVKRLPVVNQILKPIYAWRSHLHQFKRL
ncbi:MAG: hypothetical protein VKL39_09750 [Leptolyngbyaceae bacterium]|nr:hypothetical protein [Leptolyngbyaceae bacterium]